jgi:hypothetical protein
MDAFKLILVSLAGWMNRQQRHVIEYLQVEIRVVKGERAAAQFCEHYHQERNHQGLGNKIIDPDFSSDGEGEVKCRQRLGGLLRYYYRDAA